MQTYNDLMQQHDEMTGYVFKLQLGQDKLNKIIDEDNKAYDRGLVITRLDELCGLEKALRKDLSHVEMQIRLVNPRSTYIRTA